MASSTTTKTDTTHEEFAQAAGLKERDMPPADHPLMENDADVETLSDLVDARRDHDYDAPALPGDGRGPRPTDPDEDSYLTRRDLEDAMIPVDEAPDAGSDVDGILGDFGDDRVPDITGTVRGLTRGTATHLPQDIGGNGFQIEEPIDITDASMPEAIEDVTEMLIAEDRGAPAPEDSGDSEQILDATRRMI
jgi:hypothetical protein